MSVNRSILGAIGNTPTQKLRIEHLGRSYTVYAKLEFMNPSGSIKDRIAKYIIEQAERKRLLKPGYTVVEATSGNTGIALSMVTAAKGYKMLAVMPEHMTGERIKIMVNLGASLCLTQRSKGFEGAITKADVIAKSADHYFLTDQFRNLDNVRAHYYTTGQEIIQQIEGTIDAFVAGVGTGGTLMGVGKALKKRYPKILIVAVEPDEAAVLTGSTKTHDHKIAGIGDGFVPEIVDRNLVDKIVTVKSHDAVDMARKLSEEMGLMVGVSSGANILASIKIIDEIGRNRKVATVLPDRAERYFSTDLYRLADGKIRQCSKRCECPFERF